MKNEILRENLRHLIKSYGFDATYHLCLQLEQERNNLPAYLPTLLSLTTQYYHRCRWIYDVDKNTMVDTWKPILNEDKKEMLKLLSAMKGEK